MTKDGTSTITIATGTVTTLTPHKSPRTQKSTSPTRMHLLTTHTLTLIGQTTLVTPPLTTWIHLITSLSQTVAFSQVLEAP